MTSPASVATLPGAVATASARTGDPVLHAEPSRRGESPQSARPSPGRSSAASTAWAPRRRAAWRTWRACKLPCVALHLRQPAETAPPPTAAGCRRPRCRHGGIDQHVGDFVAEAAGREGVDRFLVGRRPRRERLGEQAQLAAPRQRRRGQQRRRAVGHLAQTRRRARCSGAWRRAAPRPARRQAQRLDQRQRVRLPIEEAIGPASITKPSAQVDCDVAADARSRLEHAAATADRRRARPRLPA